MEEKITRIFFYHVKSALGYPIDVRGESLTDDKAVGNRIPLAISSTDFKSNSYTGREIQI